LSADAAEITHSGASTGQLTISSTSGKVKIESVTFNLGAISTATTIAMGGSLTGATNIGMNGALTGATNIGMNGALTGVGTSAFSGEMTFSAAAAKITHSGGTSLTIKSTNQEVLIEDVTFTDGAISDATSIAMGGSLTGATNIVMNGALTGATNIGMNGALTGVSNLAVSGTITTPTTIAASSTITTSSYFVAHKSFGIKTGAVAAYTGTTIASWHGVIKKAGQTFTGSHPFKNYDMTWAATPIALTQATIIASICDSSMTTARGGLSVRVYSRAATSFSLQVFADYTGVNFGTIDLYVCYIIIWQS
jgi:hypothetical protein